MFLRSAIFSLTLCIWTVAFSPFALSQSVTSEEAATQVKGSSEKKPSKVKQKGPTKTTTFQSFRNAQKSGYELQNAGDFQASRDAYEAALEMEITSRQRCEVYRQLASVYPELGLWKEMFKATEHIVEHAPYPAFSSLAVRGMVSTVYRKKKQKELLRRYETKLFKDPKDRTSLIILEAAVSGLMHDMAREADLLRRLIELDKEEGKSPDTDRMAALAFKLRLSDKEVESAELYQSIADMDEKMRAFCLAEAAESWQKAGEEEKAIEIAKRASKLGPGVRASRSLYRWNRQLADLFLKHLNKPLALKHYTVALDHANIDAYREQCRDRLKLVNALKD